MLLDIEPSRVYDFQHITCRDLGGQLAVNTPHMKRRREGLGLTQAEVADAVGVTRSTVNLWERGKYQPRAADLPKLAEVLQTTVKALLADPDPDPWPKVSEPEVAATP